MATRGVKASVLSDALRDGNTIRAVIRGTGPNQDRRTPGITQPSRIAQEMLIRDTYVSAGLDLINLAYTLTSKRILLPWKSHLVCETVKELIRNLEGNLPRPIRSFGTAPALGVVLTGQVAQWYAMGRELIAYLVFKKSLGKADRFLRILGCHWSLIGNRFLHTNFLAGD